MTNATSCKSLNGSTSNRSKSYHKEVEILEMLKCGQANKIGCAEK
jgi:hypothetical protein